MDRIINVSICPDTSNQDGGVVVCALTESGEVYLSNGAVDDWYDMTPKVEKKATIDGEFKNDK